MGLCDTFDGDGEKAMVGGIGGGGGSVSRPNPKKRFGDLGDRRSGMGAV